MGGIEDDFWGLIRDWMEQPIHTEEAPLGITGVACISPPTCLMEGKRVLRCLTTAGGLGSGF